LLAKWQVDRMIHRPVVMSFGCDLAILMLVTARFQISLRQVKSSQVK
jgi:hypothetical protein